MQALEQAGKLDTGAVATQDNRELQREFENL